MPDKLELPFPTQAADWETSPSHRAEEGLPGMGSMPTVPGFLAQCSTLLWTELCYPPSHMLKP